MYVALVTLTAVIVPLAVLLNLVVVITVYMNRKLHTIINVLVVVLCANNAVWVVSPILIARYPSNRGASCMVNKFIFHATRDIMFATIVIITLLRYLIVVRNHRYPVRRRNSIIFMSAAILPGVVHWAIETNRFKLDCEEEVAWMSDGHAIFLWDESSEVMMTSPINTIAMLIKYGTGIAILAFSYRGILMTASRSRKRLSKTLAYPRQHGTLAVEGSACANQCTTVDEPGATITPVRDSTRDDALEEQQTVRMGNLSYTSSTQPQQERVSPALVSSSHGLGGVSADPPRVRSSLVAALAEVEAQSRPRLPIIQEIGSSMAQLLMVAEAPSSQQGQDMFEADVKVDNDVDLASTSSRAQEVRVSPEEHLAATTEAPLNPVLLVNGRPPDDMLAVYQEPLHANCSMESHPASWPGQSVRPPASRHRVDIVATLSLSSILLIFLVSLLPVLALTVTLSGASCAILPDQRLMMFLMAIGGAGAAAIFSPLVLVLFSSDFRRALHHTAHRLAVRCPQ